MKSLEDIRDCIEKCDDKIIRALTERMQLIQEIIAYKKENGIAVFQPEQEKKQKKILEQKLNSHKFEEEIEDIFRYIIENSKKIQAKSLFEKNIVLVGFMGVGKTSVSQYLGRMLALEIAETDQFIVEKEGICIREIFEKYGEEYFRNCESNVIRELRDRHQMVISVGGGAVLRDINVENMKYNGKIVLLTASPKTVLERVEGSDERPILNGNMNTTFIKMLMEKREGRYQDIADVVVETDGKTIQEICEEIIGKL